MPIKAIYKTFAAAASLYARIPLLSNAVADILHYFSSNGLSDDAH